MHRVDGGLPPIAAIRRPVPAVTWLDPRPGSRPGRGHPYGKVVAWAYLGALPGLITGVVWGIVADSGTTAPWFLVLLGPSVLGMSICGYAVARVDDLDAPTDGWRRLITMGGSQRWWYRFVLGLEVPRAVRVVRGR